MDNVRDMYYLLQVIIQKIFVFLRDLVVHEFPKLLSSNIPKEAVDGVENFKNRATSSIKHNYVDFAVCFILCSFVAVVIFLSVKDNNKENENDEFTDKPSTERIVVNLPEDQIYHFPQNWSSKMSKYYNDRGDEYFTEEDESPRIETAPKEMCRSKEKTKEKSRTPSICGDSSQCSERSDSVQNVSSQRLWLIRKTRSGHIYGKYPI